MECGLCSASDTLGNSLEGLYNRVKWLPWFQKPQIAKGLRVVFILMEIYSVTQILQNTRQNKSNARPYLWGPSDTHPVVVQASPVSCSLWVYVRQLRQTAGTFPTCQILSWRDLYLKVLLQPVKPFSFPMLLVQPVLIKLSPLGGGVKMKAHSWTAVHLNS